MRATDIGIVKPAKAVLVASGGAPPTVRRIKAAGITAFTEGATGYQRDSSRRAPYNLFMDLKKLATKVKAKDTVDSYLPFGSAQGPAAGPEGRAGWPRRSPAGTPRTGRTSGGKYTNQNSFAAAGDQFRPDNVLVLRVQVGDAGYKDPAGNPVPETKFTGTGKAMLFHGGRVVRGTWKKSLDSTITLRTKAGELAGAGRPHLDRAGARRTAATSSSRSSGLTACRSRGPARVGGPAERRAGLGHGAAGRRGCSRSRPRPRRRPCGGPRQSTPRPRRRTSRRRRPG